MNLTPHQKRQLTLVLILLFGIPATVFLVYTGIKFFANAGSDATPKDVLISNITSSSLTVSWVTEKKTDGYVVTIANGTEQSPVSDVRGDEKRVTHNVVLKSLEPSTEYTFIILSDGKKFKNKGEVEFKFTTAAVSENPISPNSKIGTIQGEGSEDAIVYVAFADKSSYPSSSAVPTSGNWTLEMSTLRSVENKDSLQITDDTELVVLARSGINRGGVLQGKYSVLFTDQKLNDYIELEEVEEGWLSEYLSNAVDLGNTEEIVVPEVPEVPEEPETPEEPAKPVVPVQPKTYTVRRDIVWESLSGSSSGIELDSGEDTVTITNLSDTYAVILWRSEQKEEGYIKYGTSKTELSEELIDSRDSFSEKGEYYSHYIESGRLEPDTTYYFEIYSGDDVYDNDGQKYTLETYSTLSSAPPYETRVGKIINASDLSDWVLVGKIVDNDELGTTGSSGLLSVLPNSNGTWELVVGDVRSLDGSSYFSFSDSDILQMYVLGSSDDKYDFNLSLDDIQLDISKLGEGTGGKVNPLLDYGILN